MIEIELIVGSLPMPLGQDLSMVPGDESFVILIEKIVFVIVDNVDQIFQGLLLE